MKKIIPLVFLFVSALHGQTETIKINSINFSGNENFGSGTLHGLMSLQPSTWFSSHYFNADIFQEDLNSIKSFYHQQGFSNIKIEGYKLQYTEDSTELDISIHLAEGIPVKISHIHFSGNKHFTDNQILEKMSILPDERYQLNKIRRSRNNIKLAYMNAGYLDSDISVDTLNNGNNCDLVFNIHEGNRYSINDIKIEGLQKVKPGIVLRELEFSKNQFINYELFVKTQRNLYHTNLFKSVIITPENSADKLKSGKDVLIKLTEDNLGVYDLAVGYGTIEKFRVSSEVSYKNFLGMGYRSKLAGKISSIENNVEPSITDPWIFGIPWNLGLVGRLGKKKEPSYSFNYFGGEINFFKEFLDRSKFYITGSYEKDFFNEINFNIYKENDMEQNFTPEEQIALEEILKNFDITIHRSSLKAALLYDLRNNLFDPSSGFIVDISSEFIYGVANLRFYKIPLLHSINRILRNQAICKYFYSLDHLTTVAGSLDMGIIDDFSGEAITFLLDDFFYAGGPSSIRGFGYQMVGPLSENNSPLGGELKLVWNLELRRRIIWIISGVAFFDAGNVWTKPKDFRFNDLRYSPGFGLRVDTPIGTARLDYGFNPWPQNNEDRGQLWIGIGHSF